MPKALPTPVLLLVVSVVLVAACAAPQAPRDPAAAKRGIEEAKEREPYLPMLPEEEAREAMPGFKGKRTPDLVRVAAHLPKTWAAEMAAWRALAEEGTIDRKLLSEVFYVVSSANDCFYCMGHTVMTSELAGVPESDVLRFEETADPQRRAMFAYARKASREPESLTRADVDSLRPYLTDAQIVELDLALCRYNTMNRLAHAFGVPLERENVFAPAAADVVSGPGHTPFRVNAVKGILVGITVGSRDGARVGDVFILSRGSAYVGRVVLTSVDENQSVGEFDGGPGCSVPPQVGDQATRGTRPADRGRGAPGLVASIGSENRVTISVGSYDGVRVGDIYSLSRGALYVGRITITQVDKSQSVGLFDEKYPGGGAPPQAGDKASPSVE